jgi:hypothetical protein
MGIWMSPDSNITQLCTCPLHVFLAAVFITRGRLQIRPNRLYIRTKRLYKKPRVPGSGRPFVSPPHQVTKCLVNPRSSKMSLSQTPNDPLRGVSPPFPARSLQLSRKPRPFIPRPKSLQYPSDPLPHPKPTPPSQRPPSTSAAALAHLQTAR